MNTFFIVLLLVSVVCFVVGIIKPSLLKIKSRKQASVIFGISFLLLFILVGATTEKKASSTTDKVVTKTTEVKTLSLEDRIRSEVNKVNLVKLTLGKIENKPDEEVKGGELVTVNINVTDTYSKDIFFKKTGSLSSKIYQAVFNDNSKASSVIVQYQGEKVDEFGKKEVGNFLVETIDKSTYEKVQWDNFDTTTLCEFLRKNNTNSKGDLVNFCGVFVNNLR